MQSTTASYGTSEDMQLLAHYYKEWSTKADNNVRLAIPTFYEKPLEDNDDEKSGGDLRMKLREEARSTFLQGRNRQLLDNAELKELWSILEEHHTPPVVNQEKMINYKDFKTAAAKASPKAKLFFTACAFAKLQQRDPFGRIPILSFFNFIMRKTWLRQSRIGLSLYDIQGHGYLTEKDLELYIAELVPTLPLLERMETSFMNFYVCTVVRRFFFFLDPQRFGRLRIVDVLASGFLDDLLELRNGPQQNANADGQNSESSTPRVDSNTNASADSNPSIRSLERNWFSLENALRVYGLYLNLDTDKNGLLSKSELKQYGSGNLTTAFIDRLYQECLTYDGEMDYKAYLDFVLAMENKKHSSSLQYFLRILDVRQKGYLDGFSINYFFRAIQNLLREQDQPMVFIEDISDEIFDMVKPKQPARISLQDLINCEQGDTVVNILIDLNGFWTYENREYLATDVQQTEQEAQC